MKKSQIVQGVIYVALLALIFFGVHSVIEAKDANGECMEPHIYDGNLFMVVKAAYWFDEPARGDVIVFLYPGNISQEYVKRVIGLPGETIDIENESVYVNGSLLTEPYVNGPTLPKGYGYDHVVLQQGQYFVMGDNRQFSSDSRTWGVVPRENIIGRAYLVYWPLHNWYLLHGYSYSPS